MLTVILILTLLNSCGIGFILVKKFIDFYVIEKREVYQELLDYWLKNHDDEGNELTQELAGGVGVPYQGFFQEYIDEEEEGDE